MSYRPKVKINAEGTMEDLPLDAETLGGKTKSEVVSEARNGLQPSSTAITTSNIGSQNVNSAGAVRDAGSGTSITLKYSSGGNATPEYYAVWNGYQITYASTAQVKSHLGINDKANKSTTLSGYGITDAYTKTQVNTELAKKQPTGNYAKTDAANTFSKDQTYSGFLKILGTAGDHHLITRGIAGSTTDGSAVDDLYLQFGTNKAVRFGSSGQGALYSDGTIAEAGKKLSEIYQTKGSYATTAQLSNKQDKLIAGSGITIASDGKTISANGGGTKLYRHEVTTSGGAELIDGDIILINTRATSILTSGETTLGSYIDAALYYNLTKEIPLKLMAPCSNQGGEMCDLIYTGGSYLHVINDRDDPSRGVTYVDLYTLKLISDKVTEL